MMPHLICPVEDKDHRLGSPKAPACLVEYGDYQCGICRLSIPMMKLLKKELGDRFCFVFRHFPFSQAHPLAKEAAEAAEAAACQNKFWEMHDLLYANQLQMSSDLFNQLARELALDIEKFQNDLKSPEIAKKIETDFKGGLRSGVNGTPCFFINGERYDGDGSYDTLKKILQ